ncbi:hypothetical protein EDD63_10647 [Breznakia blatticola]|uniref:Thioredoxin-like protein n=1 Tax=Breznakia blatticola TaxID=1754012 RepID=A0A4R8A471_9FIRM|nr:hypothetical protein [Breznakia blatticola]TDW25106.1 hypothetical protein EDD63_10647 [Breznakia blatticola]
MFYAYHRLSKKDEYSFVSIGEEQILEKVNNGEDFLLLITYDGSSACQEFEELIIDEFKENNVVLYTFNETDVNDAFENQLEHALSGYDSWPVMFHIRSGEVVSDGVYEYSKEPNEWKQWLISQGILSGN